MNQSTLTHALGVLRDRLALLQTLVDELPQTQHQSEALSQAFGALEGCVSACLTQENPIAAAEAAETVQASKEQLRLLTDHTREVVCLHEPDGRFLYVSPSCDRLLGIQPEALVGTDPYELIHPDDRAVILTQSHRPVLQRICINSAVCRVRHQSGTYVWIETHIQPIYNQQGQIIQLVTSSRDVSQRKQVEEKIQAALREKEALLAEIHHRVRNNLHIISSLFYLQANRISDRQTRELLQDSRNRVNSMALVHESLYQTQNFADVNLTQYIHRLAMNVFRTYKIDPDIVGLYVNVATDIAIRLDQAIPCGLIINELITNAFKHGFRDNCCGKVSVSLEAVPDRRIALIVSNTGDKLPPDFDLNCVQSMGLKLVIILVEQLRGTIEVEQGDATRFSVVFHA